MTERPRFFDDLAGVAGGAMSALSGLRDEAEALVRARVDETIRKLDLIRREELEAVSELAANARSAQQAAEASATAMVARLSLLETELATLRSRIEALEPKSYGGGGPGMIA